jgi:CubicO group peptidase (beta-lactamase class C family)
MGKTYVATAVMQLVERGVIDLYDPINKHLEIFKVKNPLGEKEITFYDLLTHRTGLAINMAGCHFVPPKPLGEHLKEGYSQASFKSYKGTWLPRWTAKVGFPAGRLKSGKNISIPTLAWQRWVIWWRSPTRMG